VLSDPFCTKAGRVMVGLLAEGWTPARVAAACPAELRQLFAARGCRLSGPLAGRLIARAAAALPAHPAATVGKAATLAGLLGAMTALDRQIAGLEAEMGPLLARTQGAKLTQLRGVATVAAAGFVAFVGHTGRWSEWSKVWRAAGLDPARSQSGATDQSYGISREGSAWGRRAILDLAASVCRQPGRWQDGYRARTVTGHKHPKVALAATGNQIGRTLFALMDSGADYDPDHQAKRLQRRRTNQPRVGGRAA
jgi:transposase